jgi:endonuclease YncB( thermonuclease family)
VKVTRITNAVYALSVVAVIGFGLATEYLGELTPKATAENAVPASAVEHRVQRIVDGDTVYMRDGTKVRLHGIDTPERDQPYGKQATRNLDKLIGGKVFVAEKDIDRYGRLVGVIYTPEGVNVNEAMVCGGHAWWYSRYARFESDLRDCQDSAQEE